MLGVKDRMPRKKVVALLCIMIALIALGGIITMIATNKENGITKYEWIKRLSQKFNIVEYQNKVPYFQDVTAENEYFEYVQAACEYGIVDEEKLFQGDEVVTGKYVALTTMKAIGKYKVQIYMGLEQLPDEKEYLQLAFEKELIPESKLKESITEEQADDIIQKAYEMFYSELWLDDYVDIQYRDDVVVLSSEDIIEQKFDITEIKVQTSIAEKLSSGTNIVFTDKNTGKDYAKKVVSVDSEGNVILTEADLSEVLQSMMVSDIGRVNTEDIFKEYQTAKTDNVYIVETAFGEKEYKNASDGFQVKLSVESGELSVTITDNATKLSQKIPTQIKLDMDEEVDVTVDVSNIDVGVQLSHDGINVNYIDVQVESDITCTGNVAFSESVSVPLFVAPIYLGNGLIGIKIPFYLVLSLDGSISLEAGIPIKMTCEYSKDSGLRVNQDISCTVNAEASCEASVVLRAEPILQLSVLGVLEQNLIDLEADIGISATATVRLRNDPKLKMCAEICLSAPIVTISFLGDEGAESLLGEFIEPYSFDIYTNDNAPYRKGFHCEWYTNGKSAIVDKCTYKKEAGDTMLDYLVRIYEANFEAEFLDEGDYYSTIGKVYHQAYISADTAKNLKAGDTYKFADKKYIFEGIVTADELFGGKSVAYDGSVGVEDMRYYKFSVAGDKAIYYTYAPPSEPMPIGENYASGKQSIYDYIYTFSKYECEDEYISRDVPIMAVVADGYQFKILKNATVDIMTANSKEGDEYGFSYEQYTVEECFENNIEDYQKRVMTQGEAMDVDVYFTEDGYVEHIYVYPVWDGQLSFAEQVSEAEK